MRYQEWLDAEDLFDQDVREHLLPTLEQDWHERFSKSAHEDMSQTPAYLVEDAAASKSPNVCDATNIETMDTLDADAARFNKIYFADVQKIFSHVQHHMHKRTKKGCVPLKTCQRKCGKKCSMTCKYDFPRTRLRTHKSMLVCRGVARKYKLQLSGGRNAFGSIFGQAKMRMAERYLT